MARTRTLLLLAALSLAALARTAGATGLLVPGEPGLPPLSIKYHRVSVRIQDGVATTELKEAFQNDTDRRLEATYIFPVPRDAALTDFAMYINGKRQSGEVLDAGKARQIYMDIVRQMRDPGLLEYIGSNLLRMRVFPIEPHSVTSIELTYSHPLPYDGGVYEYTFPLKTGTRASRVMEDFSVTVDITSREPIKSVYSPTHEVGVARKDDHHVVVGLEKTGMMLDRDFTLFYAVGREDFGLNLLTHRVAGEDGFFALMIAPGVEAGSEKEMPKDVCFVIDTSGSMAEQDRIGSARKALEFCLRSLEPRDRFAVVSFATSVDVLGDGLADATPDAIKAAVENVGKLRASGSTDLCGALVQALAMAPGTARPYLVVLVTDGKPTSGVTMPDQIIAEVAKANKSSVRVFTFGITEPAETPQPPAGRRRMPVDPTLGSGENLDVPLMDRIAETTRGYTDYVAPGADIEQKISSFFSKASHPVLAGLKLDFGRMKVKDLYPRDLPDLFRGGQLIVFGRYAGSGDVAVTLSGTVDEKAVRFSYDAAFPEESPSNAFVAPLWARRKIGYLLDQIRLHGDATATGESNELVDEIVALSKQYGIATPYTSYLVLEPGMADRYAGALSDDDVYLTSARARREAYENPAYGALHASDYPSAQERVGAPGGKVTNYIVLPSQGAQEQTGATGGRAAGPDTGLDLSTGQYVWMTNGGGASQSIEMKRMKESDVAAGGDESPLVRVGERLFAHLPGGAYLDQAYKEEMPSLKIKWGSDAYFAVLDAMPELTDCLALGTDVVIVVDGKALLIGQEGEETMTAAKIKEFFSAKAEDKDKDKD